MRLEHVVRLGGSGVVRRLLLTAFRLARPGTPFVVCALVVPEIIEVVQTHWWVLLNKGCERTAKARTGDLSVGRADAGVPRPGGRLSHVAPPSRPPANPPACAIDDVQAPSTRSHRASDLLVMWR